MSSSAARRAHHKSKLGCTTCKRRRIKCDEGRPSCKNCIKRSLECSFPQLDPTYRFSSTSPTQDEKASFQVHVFPQAFTSPPSSLPLPTLLDVFVQTGLLKNAPDILRPRFNQILHHFMKVTSATIAPNNSQAVWTDVIPQLAADHLFVLQGIFAVGSLHLSRSGANERDQKLFSNIAAGQLSVGLSQFRSAIQKPTEQNVEALCAFNTVTTSFMLTSAAEESKTIIQLLQKNILTKGQRQKVINDLVHVTSRVFRSFRGVMIFLVPFWYHLMEGRLAPLLNRAWWPLSVVTTPQAFEEDRILRNLERMWMNSGREYEIYNDHLKAALKHLRETFALASQLTTHAQTTNTTFDWSSVFTWPIASTFDFIDLIERQQYEAWVIVAHWAVLPSRIENVWWIDLAPNIIATAAYALDESKWHLIEWPARVVGVDLENFRVPTTSLPQLGKPLESPVKSSTSQDGTTVVDRGRLHLSNFGP